MKLAALIRRLAGPLNTRATIENPSVSLNDPDAWDAMFGAARDTEAGLKVDARRAMSYSPVWQAVNMISGDIAKLPFELWKNLDDDDRERDKRHPAYNLVRWQPNDEQSSITFWEQLVAHALLYQGGYAWIERAGDGRPLGLYPLLPDRTAPERHRGQLIYVSEVNGRLEPFHPSEIFHLKRLSLDGLSGCDLVDHAKDEIALGLAARQFASKFFKHGGRKGGILELPVTLQKKARDNMETGFRKTYEGADNPFKTIVLREGAKFHEAQASLADSQMVESRHESIRDVARFFNVRPSLLGVEDGTSYNSKEDDKQSYLDQTLDIWLQKLAIESRLKLLTLAERQADSHFFEHNTAALLRTNIETRYKVYAMGIRNRIINPNEVRRRENMRPYEGGDEFLIAPGMGNAAQQGEGVTDDGSSGNTTPDGEDAGTSERNHQRRRVLYNLGARARHKSKNAAAFLEWLDGGLQSHRAEYRELCGDDDQQFFAPILARLNELAETTTAAELPAAVDDLMTQLETKDQGPTTNAP